MIGKGLQEWLALGLVSLVAAAILMPVFSGLAAMRAQALLRKGKVKRAMWWRSIASRLQR